MASGITLPISVSGSCLCGSVRYEVSGTPIGFDLDNCSRCRKSSGSAFKAELLLQACDFSWVTGGDLVRVWEAPVRDQPPGYRRCFCATCGGPVPTVDADTINIPAGTLDEDPGERPQRHIFVAVKAPWFDITDALPRLSRK
jgi:hypothetical protein